MSESDTSPAPKFLVPRPEGAPLKRTSSAAPPSPEVQPLLSAMKSSRPPASETSPRWQETGRRLATAEGGRNQPAEPPDESNPAAGATEWPDEDDEELTAVTPAAVLAGFLQGPASDPSNALSSKPPSPPSSAPMSVHPVRPPSAQPPPAPDPHLLTPAPPAPRAPVATVLGLAPPPPPPAEVPGSTPDASPGPVSDKRVPFSVLKSPDDDVPTDAAPEATANASSQTPPEGEQPQPSKVLLSGADPGGAEAAFEDEKTQVGVRRASYRAVARSRRASSRALPWLAGAAAVVLVAVVWALSANTKGSLLVTVAGPGGLELGALKVWVDDELACPSSPCRVTELSGGAHFVRAEVPGYPSVAEQAVVVTAGEETAHNLNLESLAPAHVLVTSAVTSLAVSVDGEPRGTPPFKLQLAPGKHVLEATGAGLRPLVESFELTPGQEKELGPLLPQLLEGRLRIESTAHVAATLDDKRIRLPFDAPVDATTPHQLVAWRAGFEPLKRQLVFTAAQREQTVVIDLQRKEKGSRDEEVDDGAEKEAAPAAEDAKKPARELPATATLHISSSPSASVLVDGTPHGQTPQRNIRVRHGLHTITYVHPERGRKTVHVRVASGETKRIHSRLPQP